MNFQKIKIIQKWDVFTTIKEILNFLDFDNFYRRFVKNFNKLIESLIELIKKNVFFVWFKNCQKVFITLKKIFAKESILRHYDFENEIQLKVNVSNRMIEKVMFQKNEHDIWKFVIYFFIIMIVVEFNYEIYDKKLFVIVRAFEEWRFKLEKSKFFVQIISKHKNFEYFMSFKLFNRRQIRWFEFLFRFDFKIVYRFEKQNNVVDVFNRQSKIFLKKKKMNKFMWQ